jgi:hypothetical protein
VVLLATVYNGFKFCPSLLGTVGICIPAQNFREFPFFVVLVPHIKLVPLLDVHQLQIPFAKLYLVNI